jgi:predicted RNase H-like HicB family nuclease
MIMVKAMTQRLIIAFGSQVTFQIYKGDKQYVAQGVDACIVTQAKTLEELTKNIFEATLLHFDNV